MKLRRNNSSSCNVMKFDSKRFSCFPEEEETLFYGGDTELRIKGIEHWTHGRWKRYDKFMEPINALNLMIKSKPLRDQPIWTNLKTQKKMNCIVRDYLYEKLSQSDNMKCPQYVSSLVSYQMSSQEHIRLNWNELKIGYQWMSCMLRADDNQLDIGNLAVLFAASSSITFVASDGVDLEEEEWESVINGLSKVHTMGLSMSIRFELSSDESQQYAMYTMATGYLDINKSKWKCQHDGNVLIFNTDNNMDNESQSERANCIESMICRVEAEIQSNEGSNEH